MSNADKTNPKKIKSQSKNRRAFLQKSSLAAISAFLGTNIVHAATMPNDYIPVALPADFDPMKGKSEGMIIRNEKPWNVEPAPHLLNDAITPFASIFIRNNGLIPKDVDAANWTLTIGGESAVQEKTYTLEAP